VDWALVLDEAEVDLSRFAITRCGSTRPVWRPFWDDGGEDAIDRLIRGEFMAD